MFEYLDFLVATKKNLENMAKPIKHKVELVENYSDANSSWELKDMKGRVVAKGPSDYIAFMIDKLASSGKNVRTSKKPIKTIKVYEVFLLRDDKYQLLGFFDSYELAEIVVKNNSGYIIMERNVYESAQDLAEFVLRNKNSKKSLNTGNALTAYGE